MSRFFIAKLILVAMMFAMAGMTSAQSRMETVRVEGLVKKNLVLSFDNLDKMEVVSIRVPADSGQHDTYSGVSLTQILALAGVPSGEELRGANLTKYLLIEASDGYKVLFSLAEIDSLFKDEQVILANRKNGSFLPEREGPFRVIVGGEKRKARYIRNVTSLRIGDVESR